MPPISDKHLIKTILKHFAKDVEIVVMTCGISNIPKFESLLREYENISRNNNIYKQNYDVNDSYVQVKRESFEGGSSGPRVQTGCYDNNAYTKTENVHKGHSKQDLCLGPATLHK